MCGPKGGTGAPPNYSEKRLAIAKDIILTMIARGDTRIDNITIDYAYEIANRLIEKSNSDGGTS